MCLWCMYLVQRNTCREMGAHEVLSIHFTDSIFSAVPCSSSIFRRLIDYKRYKFTHRRQKAQLVNIQKGIFVVCCLIAGIAGSSPAKGMPFCLLSLLCNV
jgi:hypothetical protein